MCNPCEFIYMKGFIYTKHENSRMLFHKKILGMHWIFKMKTRSNASLFQTSNLPATIKWQAPNS